MDLPIIILGSLLCSIVSNSNRLKHLNSEFEKNHFITALSLSLLLHGLFLLYSNPFAISKDHKPIAIKVLTLPKEVSIQAESVPQQIVSPSIPSEMPPPEALFRSEHDSIAENQTIRRGQIDAGTIGVRTHEPRPKQENKTSKEKPLTQKASENNKVTAKEVSASKSPNQFAKLRLSDDLVQQRVLDNTHDKKTEKKNLSRQDSESTSEYERMEKFTERQPFGPSGFAALFRGQKGDADYLPNIPDGDITLLNVKADRFAVFVRRVAHQVFGSLRQKSWQELSAREISMLGGFVDVLAVMSPDGKLLRVQVLSSSGNERFDRMVASSAQEGAWDKNPPTGALAADGNIHFIFKAKTWTRGGREGFREQRWLLLGTGLL